jgi:hypothetical protein
MVPYAEHCDECGGTFAIDAMETSESGFRLHATIQNTGEHGTLTLLLDGSRVFALRAPEAREWADSYSWRREQGQLGMALYDRAKAEWGYGIRPEDESNFPKPIQPGERWEGWFESKRALPDETVAIIVGIGAFRLEVPDRTMFFLTHDGNRPFVSLTGHVVPVEPLSPPIWLAAKVVGAIKPQLNLCNLGVFIGGSIGATLDWLTLGVGFVGLFAGMVVGYQVARKFISARYRRPPVRLPS